MWVEVLFCSVFFISIIFRGKTHCGLFRREGKEEGSRVGWRVRVSTIV